MQKLKMILSILFIPSLFLTGCSGKVYGPTKTTRDLELSDPDYGAHSDPWNRGYGNDKFGLLNYKGDHEPKSAGTIKEKNNNPPAS
ncbi:MAG: hypothetical protein K1X44_06875 [Alphaproteobacteria bacterium]|nr:hypothetical protein [Alphaproteobacteria bacterium]